MSTNLPKFVPMWFSFGRVHAYLLEDEQGLTLIDALADNQGKTIFNTIASMGHQPKDLRRIILDGIWNKPWGHGLAQGVIPLNRVMSEIGG